jgi:uncharacterized protein (DUF952 family)
MSHIYHILPRTDWHAAQAQGEYRAASLASEGFIHFSTDEQWQRVLQMFYAGRADLLLLEVDTGRLAAQLRWEPPAPNPDNSSELFPHLYGALNLDAVITVREI